MLDSSLLYKGKIEFCFQGCRNITVMVVGDIKNRVIVSTHRMCYNVHRACIVGVGVSLQATNHTIIIINFEGSQ